MSWGNKRPSNPLKSAPTENLMLKEHVRDDEFTVAIQEFLSITRAGYVYGLDTVDHRELAQGSELFEAAYLEAVLLVMLVKRQQLPRTLQTITRLVIEQHMIAPKPRTKRKKKKDDPPTEG